MFRSRIIRWTNSLLLSGVLCSLASPLAAQPDTIHVWTFNPKDRVDNSAQAQIWSSVRLLDDNGYAGSIQVNGDITKPDGTVLGKLIFSGIAVVGVRSADGKREAYDLNSGFKLDDAWQRVAANGRLTVETHGVKRKVFNETTFDFDDQFGGGFVAELSALADGYTNVANGAGTQGGFGPAIRLTNRQNATIALDLNNCCSKNDPDGDGPITSVTASAAVVTGVSAIRGHAGKFGVTSALRLEGGTAEERATARERLRTAAKDAKVFDKQGNPDVVSWFCLLAFQDRQTRVIQVINNATVVPKFSYELNAVPSAPAAPPSPDVFEGTLFDGYHIVIDPPAGGAVAVYNAFDDPIDPLASITIGSGDLSIPTTFTTRQLLELPAAPPLPGAASGVFDFRFNDIEPPISGELEYRLRVRGDPSLASLYFFDGVSWTPIASWVEGQYRVGRIARLGVVAAFSPVEPVPVLGPSGLVALGMLLAAGALAAGIMRRASRA